MTGPALPIAVALMLLAPAAGAAGASEAAGDDDETEEENEAEADTQGNTAATPAAPHRARPPEVERRDVEPLLAPVFEQQLDFCNDPKYALTTDERVWCELVPAGDARCPKLREICARGATAKLVERQPGSRSRTLELPAFPPVMRYLVWGLLGLLAFALVRRLVSHALAQRRAEPDADAAPDAAGDREAGPAAAAARRVETDVAALLERARRAAAAGSFRGAIEDAYAALLRKLEGAGIITVEADRTNGDHVRDVARKLPAIRPRVQQVVTGVEAIEFGGEAADEVRFRSVYDGVVALVAERLAGFAPLVLGLSLWAALPGCTNERQSWERSPSGRAAVVDLLQRYGFDTRERLSPLAKIDGARNQVVLLPGAEVSDEDWLGLGAWVGAGGTLLIAGGARELPSWIPVKISRSKGAVSAPLRIDEHQRERFPELAPLVPTQHALTVVAAPAGQEAETVVPAPLLWSGSALYAAELTFDGDGRVLVLADDALFTNVSLLVGGNAGLLTELLRPGGKTVDLAGDLTGIVSPNPLASVQRGRLAPVMLQLTLLALLFFAFKGARFGRPVDPPAGRRRAFAEHARALGMHYARRRATRHVLELYGGYALERLRERLHLAGGNSLSSVAEAVAARTGRPLGHVMRALVEAQRTEGAAPAATSAPEDLVALREIATLLSDTGVRQ